MKSMEININFQHYYDLELYVQFWFKYLKNGVDFTECLR